MSPADLSSSADYPEALRTFQRVRQDRMYLPLERTPYRYSWMDLVQIGFGAAFLALVFAACFAVPTVIVWAQRP